MKHRLQNVKAVTVGTHPERCVPFHAQAEKFYVHVTNLGEGVTWQGTDMSGPGGGHKVTLLRDFIKKLPDDFILLFTDCYDILYNDTLSSIGNKFRKLGHKVIFAAERDIWPDSSIANSFPATNSPYKYLNSGVFIGEVGELKRMLNDSIANNADDQLYYQHLFLSDKFDVVLDTNCHIFQCHEPDIKIVDEGVLYNPYTKSYPSIYHGNGGEEAKQTFDKIKELL